MYTSDGQLLKYQQQVQYPEQIAVNKYLEIYSREGSCAFNKNLMLDAHNQIRKKHNETMLHWNRLLQSRAQAKADNISSKGCSILNLPPQQDGDLVAINGGSSYTEENVVDHFYQGVWGWNFTKNTIIDLKKPYYFQDFMQVIWNSTSEVGCGKGCCQDGEIWVCSYFPMADLNGTHIKENVLSFTDGFIDAIEEKKN